MTSDQFMELVRSLGQIEGKLDNALKRADQTDERLGVLERKVDDLRLERAKVVGIVATVSTIVTLIGWWIHG